MDHIVRLIGEFGLLAVFLNVLLDEGGLPLPAYPLLAVAGALAAQGQLSVVSVIGAAVSGAFIADNSWYWIARFHGRRVLALLCKLSLSPDSCVRQTESLFVKVGPAALLFAKFVPGLGSVAIALSGITRVPPAIFMPFALVGASLYLSLPILLGWLFHDAVTNILDTLARLGVIGLAIALVLNEEFPGRGVLRALVLLPWAVSEVVTAIHQNHDYAYHPAGAAGVWTDEQAKENYKLAGGRWHLRTIDDATHILGAEGERGNVRRLWAPYWRYARPRVVPAWFALLDLTRPVRRALGMQTKRARAAQRRYLG